MPLLLAVAVATTMAVVGFLLGWWLARRSPTQAEPEVAPVEALVSVDPVTEEAGGSDEVLPVPDRGPIERAVADLQLGLVVVGPDGEELYRNNQAKNYATGRHGDALVEAALERVVDGALLGLSLEESVDLYGPPARSLIVQASPIDDGGQLVGVAGVIEDVTEVRHVLRVRSDFVANVSHELRTPVGAMSVLAETIGSADDPEVVERLTERMQREATRLADTIDDLLALSRLESGPIEDPEIVDLVDVARISIERTAEAAAQRQVDLDLEPATDSPVLVDGDHGQLVSALANLVDNAVKYSDPGGQVVVRVDVVDGMTSSGDGGSIESSLPPFRRHAPAAHRGERWSEGSKLAEVSVFDDGIGIPDRDRERIFERFYRVDSGRSRDTGGTGLGLSIVRHALLNHRGTIDVDSVEGQGSSFTVRLPLSAVARAEIDGGSEGRSRAWSS